MYRILSAFFLAVLITSNVYAEGDSRSIRQDVKIGMDVGYTPISLPFPSTKALSAWFVVNPDWQVGLEYAWSSFGLKVFSFELGAIEEDNYLVKARYFPGTNSFNWIMGYGQRDLTVRLAADFFDLVTHDYSLVLTQTKTKFVQLGLSNQWQWESGYVLSVDWLTLNIPVDAEVVSSAQQYAKSENDRKSIEHAEDILAWYPQAWVVEFKVGFAF